MNGSHSQLSAVTTAINVSLLIMAMTMLSSCAAGIRLRTEPVALKSEEGSYRLYLYGCHHGDDLENLALVVDEHSLYRFYLFVPATSYRVITNQSFDRAIEQADRFLRCGIRTVTETHLRRIVAPDGSTAGFEILPHYNPLEVGAEEAVLVNYSQKGGIITVYITRDPSLDQRLSFPDIPGETGH